LSSSESESLDASSLTAADSIDSAYTQKQQQ